MDKYVFEDLIINPENPNLESLIGKEVYYGDTPLYCLRSANENYKIGILRSVRKNEAAPFYIDTPMGCMLDYTCIIPKKEASEYVPFDNIEELIEASLEHNKNHYLSKIGGLWLKRKETGLFELTTAINPNNDYFYFNINPSYIKNLFDKYCFLDNTPCGKEVNNG